MYKIIGSNQAEYGPATIAQIRQWIGEGRIDARTSCKAEGETDWKPIASVPAFADLFATAQPQPQASAMPPLPPPTGAPQPLGNNFGGVDARQRAMQEVSGPAIGLLITGILGIVYSGLSGIWNLFMGQSMDPFKNMPGMNPPFDMTQFQQFFKVFAGFALVLQIGIGIFIIVTSLKMKRLENHGLCLGAAIVALIPCVSPCCLLGLPLGIWALVVLNKLEVKSQFLS